MLRRAIAWLIAASLLLQGLAFSHSHATAGAPHDHDSRSHFHWHEHRHEGHDHVVQRDAAPRARRGDRTLAQGILAQGEGALTATIAHDDDAVYVGSQLGASPDRKTPHDRTVSLHAIIVLDFATLASARVASMRVGHDPPGASPRELPLYLKHLELRL